MCANIGQRIERERLEDLEDGEEVFLEPILKIPDEEVGVGPIRMKERLVAEVPARTVFEL